MRVTLPLTLPTKINSEVTTINFVRQNTNIPVPQILAFDDSRDNELGFESILIEVLPGATLKSKWRKLSKDAKRDLVQQVPNYQAQIFCHKFPDIGNIFLNPGAQSMPQQVQQESQQLLPVLGQLVFFGGDHITRDSQRGPFTESSDWIRAHLTLVLTDQEKIIRAQTIKPRSKMSKILKISLKDYLSCFPVFFRPTPTLQSYLYALTTSFPRKISSLVTTERLPVLLTESLSQHRHYGELVYSLNFFKGKIEMRSRKDKIMLQTTGKKTPVGLATTA